MDRHKIIIILVRAKNEAIVLGLNQTHNLFVLWAWVSYFGLFSAQRLHKITSSSGSFYSLSFPNFFVNLPTKKKPFSSFNFLYL